MNSHEKRIYLELTVVVAWWILVCALQPPSYFQPDPYVFFVVPFLLGAMSWGAVLGPSFKPHYRHKDTNWILKKDWFRKILLRHFWRPKKMTVFWKAVLAFLLIPPGAIIAFVFQPDGLAGWEMARHIAWSLLLGVSVALGGTMFLETIVHQGLGNFMMGIFFVVVPFSGFYIWDRPLTEKIVLLCGGLVLVVLNTFATDLARRWRDVG